jgi:asparagine synthetase B (glutamine-hydrolysing)
MPEFKNDWNCGRQPHPIETLLNEYSNDDALSAAQLCDTLWYLPSDLLPKVDITSMANSLEARSPFLDHHLMEWAATLPPGLKLHGSEGKHILRYALKDLVPPKTWRGAKWASACQSAIGCAANSSRCCTTPFFRVVLHSAVTFVPEW